MSNELTVAHPPVEWTEERLALVKQTVAKDATHAELQMFMEVCQARNLNPFLKQVYFIKRGQQITIQVSIDGLRAIAHRTGKIGGVKRGTKMVNGELFAFCEVYRKDWSEPVYEEVSLKEFKGTGPLWTQMPHQMLKKCAEASALRMAFPEDLGGLYAEEEMDQANSKPVKAKKVATVDLKEAKKVLLEITSMIQSYNVTQEQFEWATGFNSIKDIHTLPEANVALNDLTTWVLRVEEPEEDVCVDDLALELLNDEEEIEMRCGKD